MRSGNKNMITKNYITQNITSMNKYNNNNNNNGEFILAYGPPVLNSASN
jgi:hypothetical protein